MQETHSVSTRQLLRSMMSEDELERSIASVKDIDLLEEIPMPNMGGSRIQRCAKTVLRNARRQHIDVCM